MAGQVSRAFEGAGKVIIVITGTLALAAYLACAVFLFPLGLFIGFVPLWIIMWLGVTLGTLLRPSTYRSGRPARITHRRRGKGTPPRRVA
jgi:type IV secretory pathway TrbD component